MCVGVCTVHNSRFLGMTNTIGTSLFPSVFRSGETFIHVVCTNIRRNTTFTVLLQLMIILRCGVKVSLMATHSTNKKGVTNLRVTRWSQYELSARNGLLEASCGLKETYVVLNEP